MIYGAEAGISITGTLTLSSSVSNNRIIRCVSGLVLRGATGRCIIDNNAYVECGNGIQAQGTSNVVIQYGGYRPTFQFCVNPIITYGPGSTLPLVVDSPVFADSFLHPGAVTVAQPISLLPLLAKGTCHVYVQAGTLFYATSTDLVIDSAPTLTAVRNSNISNGALSIADPVFDSNSGNIRLRVFTDAERTVSYTVAFTGYVYHDF